MEHTPGPWLVANGVQIRSERDQIAKIWMMRNGEGNANASLIAAAPELLEALNKVKEELRACQAVIHLAGGFDPAYVRDAQIAMKLADAVISKATNP